MSRPETGGSGRLARGGARATLITQLLVQLGSIAATMILARLLSPADFGAIALIQSVLGASALLNLAGINAALVARRGPIEPAAASYFWLAAGIGLLVATTLFALSSAIVTSLGQPDSAVYLRVLTLSFPLTLIAMVPQAILQRSMRFRALNLTNLLPSTAYFAAEIVLAFAGWGVWAVIWGQVGEAALRLILAMFLTRWWPRHRFHLAEIREDLRLLGSLSATRALSYAQKNIDYWVLSAGAGGGLLGVYYIAYVLPNIIRLRLSEVFRTVMLPLVTQNPDHDRARLEWIKATQVMLALGIPLLAGTAAVSDPLVEVFFGTQWDKAVLPMQILTVGTISDLLIQAVSTMAIARGQAGRHTIIIAIRAFATAALVGAAALIKPSLWLIALAVTVASFVALIAQELILSRRLGVGFAPLLRTLTAATAMSAAMAGVVLIALAYLPAGINGAGRLIIGVLVGVICYVLLGWTFDRRQTQDTFHQAVRLTLGR